MLSRELRRAAAKAQRKTGRPRQFHRTRRQMLQDFGVGVFAKFTPLTEGQKDRLKLVMAARINAILAGSTDPHDWSYVAASLLEGYVTAKAIANDEQRDGWIRDIKGAAKLFDAAAVHFQNTGIVSEANILAVDEVLKDFDDLKYEGPFDRQDNIDVLNYVSANRAQIMIELFDGKPKAGLLDKEE